MLRGGDVKLVNSAAKFVIRRDALWKWINTQRGARPGKLGKQLLDYLIKPTSKPAQSLKFQFCEPINFLSGLNKLKPSFLLQSLPCLISYVPLHFTERAWGFFKSCLMYQKFLVWVISSIHNTARFKTEGTSMVGTLRRVQVKGVTNRRKKIVTLTWSIQKG